MARIRTLKPEILEDEKTAALSDSAYRLFTSMIVLADDHGNVRADARWLQCQIWWAHGSPPDVLALLVELSRLNLIHAYGVRGGTYVHVKGWEKHQRIDNAGKNRVPLPNDEDAQAIQLEPEALKGESPRVAASRREIPLDPDPDPDPEREMDMGSRGEPREKRRPARTAAVFPGTWSPRSEERAKAAEVGLNCDAEVEAFRDHHTARGTKFKDWDAAFRTWMRNAVQFGRANRKPPQQSALGTVLSIARGETT